MCRTSRTPASRFRNCIIQFWHSSTGCGCLHAFSVHYLDGFPINVPLLLQRTEAFPLDAARFQFFEHASSNSRTGGIEHPTPTAEMGEGEGCLGLLNGCFFLRSSHIHISEQHFSFRHSPIACAFPDDFREYHALLNACRWRLSHLSPLLFCPYAATHALALRARRAPYGRNCRMVIWGPRRWWTCWGNSKSGWKSRSPPTSSACMRSVESVLVAA